MAQGDELRFDLENLIAKRQATLFVGAGLSIMASGGAPEASWVGLLESAIARCESLIPNLTAGWGVRARQDIKSQDMDEVLAAAQILEVKLRRLGGEFGRWLSETVGALPLKDPEPLKALTRLGIPVITTNYDALIEKASNLPTTTWRTPAICEQVLRGDRSDILHLHGFFDDPDSIILGIQSYEKIVREEAVQALVRGLRTNQNFIFAGFGKGLDDPHFSQLFSWLCRAFGKSQYRNYLLARNSEVQELRKKYSAQNGLYILGYGDNYSDITSFLSNIASASTDSTKPRPVKAPTQDDFLGHEMSWLAKYKQALKSANGHIKFVEIPHQKETADVPIDDLFVIPDLSDLDLQTGTNRKNAIEELIACPSVILLGDPGSGKSTISSYLSWQIVGGTSPLADRIRNEMGNPVPIPMILRELKLKADLSWETLLELFLKHRIGTQLGCKDNIEWILKEKRALILLDGLDEIGSLVVRRKLRDAVQTGMAAYPGNRWIMTSRIVGYNQVPFHLQPIEQRQGGKRRRPRDEKFEVVAEPKYLAPFANAQISEFASKWYAIHETDQSLVESSASGLVNAIHDNEGTERLARIPFLLTLMALIHRKNARLPHGRAELYSRITSAYLDSIDIKRGLNDLPYSLAQKMSWLAEIGYRMQNRRFVSGSSRKSQAGVLARGSLIESWLRGFLRNSGSSDIRADAKRILEYFATRSGLLLPRGESQFAFMHLSLQEYFAAYFIENRLSASRFSQSESEPSNDQLRSWANVSIWKETLILLFELLASRRASESEGLLDLLFKDRLKEDRSGEQLIAATLLAELATDSYLTLSAATRRLAKRDCWRWHLRSRRDEGIFPYEHKSQLVSVLLAEHNGDIRQAWNSARVGAEFLRNDAKRLNLAGCHISSGLEPLSTMKSLESLNLPDTTGPLSLKGIRNLKRIQYLALENCTWLSDLEDIAELKHLRYLSIEGCTKIASLKPLSKLKNLYSIRLIGCSSLAEISTIADLPRLRSIFLGNTSSIPDLKPLCSNRSLREIHLHNIPSGTALDLSFVKKIPTLIKVCLGGSDRRLSGEQIQVLERNKQHLQEIFRKSKSSKRDES